MTAPRFSVLFTNGAYIQLTAENPAAVSLLDGKRTVEDRPAKLSYLLERVQKLGGVIVDDCEGDELTVPEFREFLRHAVG